MEKVILNNKATGLIKQSKKYLELIPKLEINNLDDAKNFKRLSENLKDFVKSLENIRLETVRPLQENVKEINSSINPTINLLDETSKKINQAIFQWQKKEIERIESEKVAALLEQAAALTQNNVSVPVQSFKQAPEPEKITKTKQVWRVEIIKKSTDEITGKSIGGIENVDPEYVTLVLDDKKIDEAVKAGRIKIRGLHIFQEEIPVRG